MRTKKSEDIEIMTLKRNPIELLLDWTFTSLFIYVVWFSDTIYSLSSSVGLQLTGKTVSSKSDIVAMWCCMETQREIKYTKITVKQGYLLDIKISAMGCKLHFWYQFFLNWKWKIHYFLLLQSQNIKNF